MALTKEDEARIRAIMNAVVDRDEDSLDELLNVNNENMDNVWKFIDSLCFKIIHPRDDFLQHAELYESEQGIAVDVSFPSTEEAESDLVLMLDIVKTAGISKFIYKGIVN
jgi:hypothetical protein